MHFQEEKDSKHLLTSVFIQFHASCLRKDKKISWTIKKYSEPRHLNSPFDPSEACPPEWGLAGSRHRWSHPRDGIFVAETRRPKGWNSGKFQGWFGPIPSDRTHFKICFDSSRCSHLRHIGYWYLFIVFKQMIWYAHICPYMPMGIGWNLSSQNSVIREGPGNYPDQELSFWTVSLGISHQRKTSVISWQIKNQQILMRRKWIGKCSNRFIPSVSQCWDSWQTTMVMILARDRARVHIRHVLLYYQLGRNHLTWLAVSNDKYLPIFMPLRIRLYQAWLAPGYFTSKPKPDFFGHCWWIATI